MSQNCPFSQREIFLKTCLMWLLSFYYDLLYSKVSQIPKGTPWDVSLLIFGSRLGPNCFVSPKIICFEHFTSANIIYLLIPIMLQSFKKIVKPDPDWIWPKLPICPTRGFFEDFTYVILTYIKIFKKKS